MKHKFPVYRLFSLMLFGALMVQFSSCKKHKDTEPEGPAEFSTPGAGVVHGGYTYATVVLGNGQEWMAENLRSGVFANGDTIPYITGATEWQMQWISGNAASTHYLNDTAYENPYGRLYSWYAVTDPRNICPTGWHVPSNADWDTLIHFLDSAHVSGVYGEESMTAGGKMKSTGTQYWAEPNGGATNESGFSGLPGGMRFDYSSWTPFAYEGLDGFWWSTEEKLPGTAWIRVLDYNDGNVMRIDHAKGEGLSVRCVKN
jgi:uncharacterized protein (TIGR02145 family)